jgi:dTDP-4-dehydrorhamnose reductase
MKVLVTGASGMLGATLVSLYQEKMDVYATGSGEFPGNPAKNYLKFDLLNGSYDALLNWADPEVIIHCAAITSINACEEVPQKALAVNGESVKKLLASSNGARMIYISSDAVFPDGIKKATEKDAVAPANVYGQSKALGERYMTGAKEPHCALRTTIVGKNINPQKQSFVEWMVKSFQKQEEISLFHDVMFTPISIWHFAEEVEWVIHSRIGGVFHLTGMEAISKFDFGLKLCEKMGFSTKCIKKASIEDFQPRIGRSKDQTLDSSFYESVSHRKLPLIDDTIDLLVKRF